MGERGRIKGGTSKVKGKSSTDGTKSPCMLNGLGLPPAAL